MTGQRFILAGIVVVVAAVAAPALAHHGNPYARGETALHKNGPWAAKNRDLTIASGHKKNMYIRLINTTSGPQEKLNVTLTDDGGGGPPEYHNAWFAGENDITHDVQTSGYDFKLKPDRKKRFRLRITANDDSVQECVFGHFELPDHSVNMYIGARVNGNGSCVA